MEGGGAHGRPRSAIGPTLLFYEHRAIAHPPAPAACEGT
eukprot:COSAG06_NODE_62701_length_257_cov_0.696970_2_plen_38_part_01